MNALPASGITTSMVANILSTSAHNVGELCTHLNINMWSRMKPIHINTSTPDRSGLWWRGTKLDCGITVPNSVVTYTEVPQHMTADKTNGWSYERPWGGSSSPYRLADFAEYLHDAKPPFSGFGVTSKVSTKGTILALLAYNISTADKEGPGSVALDDIDATSSGETQTLGDYYLGIVVMYGDTVMGRVVGGVSGTKHQTNYKASGLVQGRTYTVYPFLAKNEMGLYESDLLNIYYTVPNVEAALVRIVSDQEAAGLKISCTAKYVYDTNGNKSTVSWEVEVTSEHSSYSMSNNAIYLRYSSNDPLDPLQVGEQLHNISSFAVSPTSPYTTSGLFSINYADYNKSFYVYLTLNTGQYTVRTQIMEQINPDI